MIFISKKAFDNALNKAIWEEDERRRQRERMDDLQNQIFKLKEELYCLQMKTDPEFKRKNTPTCGSDLASVPCMTTAR